MIKYLKRILIGPGTEIRILQWNCNGIRTKRDQLRQLLLRERIDIALIQETHLNTHHSFHLGPDYVIHRKDRLTHKGGVMSVFHKKYSRHYKMNIRTPVGVEGQSWFLIHNGFSKLMLHNWYCVPVNSKHNR